MWKQEKVIDGVLCYRYSVEHEFKSYDIKEITRKYKEATADVERLIDECIELKRDLNQAIYFE